MHNRAKTNIQKHWVIILIALISFMLRVSSIQHDLPYQIISDEGSDLTTSVRLLNGELPQRHVRYHRSLIAYNNLIPVAGVGLVNFIDGDVRSTSDFEDLYFANRAEFTYATRLWMAVLTSSAILFIGLAGTYLDPKIGIASSLILALNGFFFHTSLYALPDALGASITALTIWLIMRVWRYRRTRDYIFMSLGLALVMLAKLQAASIGLGFLVAHGYITYNKVDGKWRYFLQAYIMDKNLWIAAIVGILGNLIFNPLAFLHLDDLFFEIGRLQKVVYGNQSQTFSQGIIFASKEIAILLLIIWRWAFPLTIIGLWQVWRKRQHAPYIMAFVMFIILFILTLSSRFGPISHFYYWNPWIVPMALIAGIGFIVLWDIISKTQWKRFIWLGALVFILLEGQFLAQMFTLMISPTTQSLAREYIVENIPEGSRILASNPLITGVALYRTNASIERAIDLTDKTLSQWQWWLDQPISELPTPTYNIYGPEFGEVIETFDDLIDIIQANDIEYVVVADYCDSAHQDPSNESDLAFPPVSDALVADWELLSEFSPFASGTCEANIHYRTKLTFSSALFQQIRVGPYVKIYRILP